MPVDPNLQVIKIKSVKEAMRLTYGSLRSWLENPEIVFDNLDAMYNSGDHQAKVRHSGQCCR
ncbi:MAG: hypothetical protein R2822_26180 [Spirosomataceae bacterium]